MDDLLEYLTYKTGSMYMSDLPMNSWMVPSAVRKIPEQRYSVEEWNEAIAYIFRTDQKFRSAREAKEYILTAPHTAPEILRIT